MNQELPDVRAGFRKGRGTREKITNICWIIEKAREFQKIIYICFTDYVKAFDHVEHNKLWKIIKEMGIPDHLTCFLRNMWQVKKQQIEPHMEQWSSSKVGREYVKAVLQPCYLIYMQITSCEIMGWMKHSWSPDCWEKSQQPQICRGHHFNGRKQKELKSLLMRVKEESAKAGLNLNIQKMKIMASSPISSWQITGEKVEAVINFIFLGSKITANGDCSHETERHLLLGRKVMTTLDSIL